MLERLTPDREREIDAYLAQGAIAGRLTTWLAAMRADQRAREAALLALVRLCRAVPASAEYHAAWQALPEFVCALLASERGADSESTATPGDERRRHERSHE